MRFKVLIFVSITLLNGCAFNQTIDYSNGFFTFSKFELNNDSGCSINVIDKRPYVLSGNKEPSFVGLQRALYGNPYDVLTKSGLPLSEDLRNLIARSYKEIAGVNCGKRELGNSKNISYTIKEWKTDNYFGSTFKYDFDISINSNGNLLASENTAATVKLTKEFSLNMAIINAINSLHNKKSVQQAFKN